MSRSLSTSAVVLAFHFGSAGDPGSTSHGHILLQVKPDSNSQVQAPSALGSWTDPVFVFMLLPALPRPAPTGHRRTQLHLDFDSNPTHAAPSCRRPRPSALASSALGLEQSPTWSHARPRRLLRPSSVALLSRPQLRPHFWPCPSTRARQHQARLLLDQSPSPSRPLLPFLSLPRSSPHSRGRARLLSLVIRPNPLLGLQLLASPQPLPTIRAWLHAANSLRPDPSSGWQPH